MLERTLSPEGGTAFGELQAINLRADLRTFHPDALPWPSRLGGLERIHYTRICGLPSERVEEAKAYLGKELAMLADVERHISICLGLICGQAASSRLLEGEPMMNAMMLFAAEEYQHSNMFYRYVDLLLGMPLDLSAETLATRLGLFQGPEAPEVKLVALLASAYPGETVITIFEHRMRRLDPGQEHFLTRMIGAHGLDEARHIQFDHYVFGKLLPLLTDEELLAAQRLCRAMAVCNQVLSTSYEAATRNLLGVDYLEGNEAARTQRWFHQRLVEETLSRRAFRSADAVLADEDAATLFRFAGVEAVHPAPAFAPGGASVPVARGGASWS